MEDYGWMECTNNLRVMITDSSEREASSPMPSGMGPLRYLFSLIFLYEKKELSFVIEEVLRHLQFRQLFQLLDVVW